MNVFIDSRGFRVIAINIQLISWRKFLMGRSLPDQLWRNSFSTRPCLGIRMPIGALLRGVPDLLSLAMNFQRDYNYWGFCTSTWSHNSRNLCQEQLKLCCNWQIRWWKMGEELLGNAHNERWKSHDLHPTSAWTFRKKSLFGWFYSLNQRQHKKSN